MRVILGAMALQAMLGIANAQASTSSMPAPTVTPTIQNPNAPDPQKCPGYRASNVANTNHGFTADLTLAGQPCNVFGTDIKDLTLEVSYQTKERLNVKIVPKHIATYNSSWYILDDEFVQQPEWDGRTSSRDSDLQMKWSNNPSFQFSISRRATGEEIFSTYGHVIVYENQFLEVATNMQEDYNVYGIAENIHNFRLGNDFTQTLYNADTADHLDGNSYGTHPFWQETRYSGGKSTAHGVYSRNMHGQEWLMRPTSLTFRALGGSIDFYFLSGEAASSNEPTWGGRPGWGWGGGWGHGWGRGGWWGGHHGGQQGSSSTALEVIRQYQSGCVGLPAMQMYWTFGFHQCHWGWKNVQALRDVVNNYSAAGIPLEGIWTDIDAYDRTRVFTNDPVNFGKVEMNEFHAWLQSRGQHYIPLVDSNVYFPDPGNASDYYEPFERGDKLQTFIRDSGTGYYYLGNGWPGFSTWADWLLPSSQQWFTEEMQLAHVRAPYDGIWIDLNEAASFCAYSCGNGELPANLIMPPSNTSMDTRELNAPPYKLNVSQTSTHNIIDMLILPNATHNDEYNTTDYDLHNLFSIGILRAAYNAMSQAVFPGKRPFIIGRASVAGSGRYTGNWGGDNDSRWGAMFLSISQAFGFQMSGIPMFGTDTCGFGNAVNATEELCARWTELNAFFPFYRNHYGIGKAPQEAYVWPTVAGAARRAISIRYSLLTYIYTLFYYAHTQGDTIMRALAWEFPDDATLLATDSQFLLGPSILVTPVLTEGDRTVNGVFPGIGQGTRWFDWYTMKEVKNVKPQQNVTMDAPLEYINLHIRGGSILPIQEPGNTTTTTRANPYGIIVTPDEQSSASGNLYLDDGESIEPSETKMVEFDYSRNRLTTKLTGSYHVAPPLANITVAGVARKPGRVIFQTGRGRGSDVKSEFMNNTLYVTGLEKYTQDGAWENEFSLQIY